MTPGESHNEWYHYYCSNFYPFKGKQYTRIHFRDMGIQCFLTFGDICQIYGDMGYWDPLPGSHKYERYTGPFECIFIANMYFSHIIFFQKSNAVIALPQDANITGSCNSGNLETLTVFFFTGNIWVFTLNVKGSGSTWNELFMTSANDITYSWQYVVLTYYIDSHFPDARDISGKNLG